MSKLEIKFSLPKTCLKTSSLCSRSALCTHIPFNLVMAGVVLCNTITFIINGIQACLLPPRDPIQFNIDGISKPAPRYCPLNVDPILLPGCLDSRIIEQPIQSIGRINKSKN